MAAIEDVFKSMFYKITKPFVLNRVVVMLILPGHVRILMNEISGICCLCFPPVGLQLVLLFFQIRTCFHLGLVRET